MSPSGSPVAPLYSPFGRIPRGTYTLRLLGLLAVAVVAVMAGRGGNSPVWGLVLAASGILMVFQAITRGADAGLRWWLTIPAVVVLNGLALVALMVWPSRAD